MRLVVVRRSGLFLSFAFGQKAGAGVRRHIEWQGGETDNEVFPLHHDTTGKVLGQPSYEQYKIPPLTNHQPLEVRHTPLWWSALPFNSDTVFMESLQAFLHVVLGQWILKVSLRRRKKGHIGDRTGKLSYRVRRGVTDQASIHRYPIACLCTSTLPVFFSLTTLPDARSLPDLFSPFRTYNTQRT